MQAHAGHWKQSDWLVKLLYFMYVFTCVLLNTAHAHIHITAVLTMQLECVVIDFNECTFPVLETRQGSQQAEANSLF